MNNNNRTSTDSEYITYTTGTGTAGDTTHVLPGTLGSAGKIWTSGNFPSTGLFTSVSKQLPVLRSGLKGHYKLEKKLYKLKKEIEEGNMRIADMAYSYRTQEEIDAITNQYMKVEKAMNKHLKLAQELKMHRLLHNVTHGEMEIMEGMFKYQDNFNWSKKTCINL